MIKRICLFLGIVIGMGLLVGCTQEKENYSNLSRSGTGAFNGSAGRMR